MTTLALIAGVGLVLSVFLGLSFMMARVSSWLEVLGAWAFAIASTAAIVGGVWLAAYGITGSWPS